MSNEHVQGYARTAASQRADRWRARYDEARAALVQAELTIAELEAK